MQSNDILQFINHMKICSKCYKIYGFWKKIDNLKSVYYFSSGSCNAPYQKCSSHCEDYNRKPDMPDKDINQEKWSGYDYNEKITLCYCCGQELLTSGSRWSVWFCDECKDRVVQFNTTYQRTIIPIGRHSIMAGYRLGGKDAGEDKKIEEFSLNVTRLFGGIEHLDNWRKHNMSKNFGQLGTKHTVLLKDYLQLAKKCVDKEKTFNDMVDYFVMPR